MSKEWLTDKEKRILFSALTREKGVCMQVDKQCEPREVYEQSLTSVCESLEHKFYYDRLFKQIEKEIRAEAFDEVLHKLQELRVAEYCPDGCHCSPEQDNCPYNECNNDAIDIVEQLKEQKNE